MTELTPKNEWRCARCGEALRPMPVNLAYLKSNFTVDLPCCPSCGQVFVPPDLALGKMLDVEQMLEDK